MAHEKIDMEILPIFPPILGFSFLAKIEMKTFQCSTHL